MSAEIELARIRKRAALGDVQCPCGESDLFVLEKVGDVVMCRRCWRRASGMSSIDGHHLIGKNNDRGATVPMDANDHLRLTTRFWLWPRPTQRNRSGDPLLASAALLRSLYDADDAGLLAALLPHFRPRLLSHAERLEALSRGESAAFGLRWFAHFEDDP